jgi:hypothetical protein
MTIQRVRVRWTAAARGAPHANRRRGLVRPVMLPAAPPSGEVVVHDVLADEAGDYEPRGTVFAGDVRRAGDVDLWLTIDDSGIAVDRLPGRAAYPRPGGATRLFKLRPGQVGRYRANFRFRFTECACDPSWFYEDWMVHVGNGPIAPDMFVRTVPDHEVDHRVHLYGGTAR